MRLRLPKVYPIADDTAYGVSIAEQVRILAKAGAELIQIRAKNLSDREFYEAAIVAAAVAHKSGCKLIVNDRIDVAELAGADGVHLGQFDLPPSVARQLLGPAAIIGFSTHSLEQLNEGLTLPVDYLAYGPIFPTSSKTDPDPIVGLDTLRDARARIGDLPLVAIGGIGPDTIAGVLEAGADSAAMISRIWAAPGLIDPKIVEFLTPDSQTDSGVKHD